MPHATAIAIVNITTVTSVVTSLKRGVPAGASATISGVVHRANSNPSIAPKDDSTRPSTITCCSSRARFAPRAARRASSRCRATPRASIRLATFTQAMSSTTPTLPSSSHMAARTGATACWCSGTTCADQPPLASG